MSNETWNSDIGCDWGIPTAPAFFNYLRDLEKERMEVEENRKKENRKNLNSCAKLADEVLFLRDRLEGVERRLAEATQSYLFEITVREASVSIYAYKSARRKERPIWIRDFCADWLWTRKRTLVKKAVEHIKENYGPSQIEQIHRVQEKTTERLY